MATCKYDGNEYSTGSEVCQSGRVKECIDGEWKDTGRDCGKSKPLDQSILDLSIKDSIEDNLKEISPLKDTTAGVYTHYTLKKNASQDRDKLYGIWSNQIAAVCIGQGYSAYIYKMQIKEIALLPGECSGNKVLKVVINT